ncbi:AAA family ATPase, partial [Myxococcota bacterium]|nr:AAA family ATPase [Myxococcota bacterium]
MTTEQQLQAPLPTQRMLGDYELGPELGHGAMSVVYRARRGAQSFAVKLMAESPAADAVDVRLQFRREAAAIARLHHPSLVQVVDVGETEGRPYLVMDLVEGESLDRRISRRLLSDDEVLELGKQISDALAEVHRFGLAHRDVKPANIVLGSTGQAKLIDFGLVTGATEPDAFVGTPLYAAPEQLGVLKRAVGAPADLYALGATLYECLTGRPPIEVRPGADFLHALATQTPPSLGTIRPETRPGLVAIIAKLLSKDPDDRYQSARGLLADLRAIARLEEAARSGRPLVLGAQDALVSSDQEVPLVGRKDELARLQRAWSRALSGETTFIQIEGEGGSGKTRLARELVGTAQAQGALVLTGKCQELEPVPFGPLREAADQWAAKIQRMPEAERLAAVARVQRAAGEWAPLVKRLSVGLGRLLGETGEMRALEPDAEQQRYYEALASFFANLASSSSPLVLVIDDIQWLDEGSLRVLQRLSDHSGASQVLVMSTSRNRQDSERARARYVDAIGRRLFERIELKPLRLKAVNELISARLGGRPLEPHVVEKLATLTNGNPFAIGEYLRVLLDSGVVRPVNGAWRADAQALEAVRLPRDVVELVVSRLFSLGSMTQDLLSIAAIIGGRFSVDLLMKVSGASPDLMARSLEEMVRAALVEPTDTDVYSFVHDRVREAAVERLSDVQRRDAHQSIAEALDAVEDPSPTHKYALARHYAQGHRSKCPQRVAETNLAAGLMALEDHANEEAFELLDDALGIVRGTSDFDRVAPTLLEALGRACAMTGRLDRAFDHLEDALRRAADRKSRFRLQHLLTLTYASQGRNDE